MKYSVTQGYRFYMGTVVRMYFIQGIPYTFDELPQLVQDHPSVLNQALHHHDFDDEEMYKASSYLIEEGCHPLMFDIEVDDPSLLPQDD